MRTAWLQVNEDDALQFVNDVRRIVILDTAAVSVAPPTAVKQSLKLESEIKKF